MLSDLAAMVVSLVLTAIIFLGGMVLLYGMQLNLSETPRWKHVVFFVVWVMLFFVVGDLMTSGFTGEFVATLPLALAGGAIFGILSGLVVPPLTHHVYRKYPRPPLRDDPPSNP